MDPKLNIFLTAVKRALMLVVAAIEEYQGIHIDKRRVREVLSHEATM